MDKLSLRPSLREKKRYIAFKIHSDIFAGLKVRESIEKGLFEYLGVKGMSHVGFIFMHKLYNDNKGIIRVSAKSLNDVKEGLNYIKKIDGKDAYIECILVSGVIRKVKEIIMK
jgi:RNase P/RNase MRP subunit POP5